MSLLYKYLFLLNVVFMSKIPWTYHLKQRKIAHAHIVVVDLDVGPSSIKTRLNEIQTLCSIVDHICGKTLLWRGVHTVVELSGKEVDAHDAEDEPEDQADQQHVKDGGDGTH